MLKRTQMIQNRIMEEVFGDREAGEPLKIFDIAVELDPERVPGHGNVYLALHRLVANEQLEVVLLPETFSDHLGQEVNYRGYQKPVDATL